MSEPLQARLDALKAQTGGWRERSIEQLRATLSTLCHFVWHEQLRPGEHLWSIPVDAERDFDCILSDAIDELKVRREAAAALAGEGSPVSPEQPAACRFCAGGYPRLRGRPDRHFVEGSSVACEVVRPAAGTLYETTTPENRRIVDKVMHRVAVAQSKADAIGGGAKPSQEDDSQRSWPCGCYEDQVGYHLCLAHSKEVAPVSPASKEQ